MSKFGKRVLRSSGCIEKGCLERQPSSVPFIVQYESRNNQVHFTGCKDTHYFRINIISGKIFGNLTEKMYFCTQKKSLPTERLRWSVVFLCRLYGAFLFKSQIGKFSFFCRFISFIIPLPKRTSGATLKDAFDAPKLKQLFQKLRSALVYFSFFRPLQIPFC